MTFTEIPHRDEDVRQFMWEVPNPIRPYWTVGYEESFMVPYCEARFHFRLVQTPGHPEQLRAFFNFEVEDGADNNIRVVVTTSPYMARATQVFATAIIAPDEDPVRCSHDFQLGPWASGAKILVDIGFVRGPPRPRPSSSSKKSGSKRGRDTPADKGSSKKPRVGSS